MDDLMDPIRCNSSAILPIKTIMHQVAGYLAAKVRARGKRPFLLPIQVLLK
jgi:hypothetical protein